METRRVEMVSNLSVGERRRNGGQQRYLSCKHLSLENWKGTTESFIVNFPIYISSGDPAALLEPWGGGGGVHPNMGDIGMCGPKG